MYLYNVSLGRFLHKQTPEHIAWEAGEQDAEDEASEALSEAIQPNANGEARKRKVKGRS